MNISAKDDHLSKTYDKQIIVSNKNNKNSVKLLLKLSGNRITAVKKEGEFCFCSELEKKIESNSWKNGLNIIDSFLTSYNHHFQYAYIRSIEKLSENFIQVPLRAQYLRTIILELERLQSHLNKIGFISWGLSFPFLSNKIMNLEKEISKELSDFDKFPIKIGGVVRDFENEKIKSIYRAIILVEEKITKIIQNIKRNLILKDILKETGFISRETVKKLSLVGPLARSSGMTADIRKSDPYEAYTEIDFSIPVSDYCDTYGELLVLCDEIVESSKIIKQLLYKLPNGEISSSTDKIKLISGSTIVRVESPSGELFTFIQSKQGFLDQNPRVYRITTPLKVNSQGLLSRISGEEIDNLSIILLTIGEGWIYQV
ncbi:MAG TPA: hypothetical protein VMX55_13595 [candidate division Zixibacteria bacterium]|nr:hypothetical protein [candidate division Zixibacteria bacterium]